MHRVRSTREVFEDHLQLRSKAALEEDLTRNYAEDVVLLCETGPLVGRDAIRESAHRLGLQLPGAAFEFPSKQVKDDYAFLVWTAESDRFTVHNGADSFVIRNGLIVLQTIFYRLLEGKRE